MNSYPPNYPEEYIIWKTTFFGRDFVVTPDVLIPRLETESLVRRARQSLQWTVNNKQWTIVVDIWTWSGIIWTSIADLADEIIFLDISQAALMVAEKNFRTHFPDKKAQFIVSDLLWELPELSKNNNILLLTNLPYIRNEDWQNMSVDTVHEPKLALFGWYITWFEMYERLFEQFSRITKNQDKRNISCIYEFGFDQRKVAELVVSNYHQWNYSFFADYAGIERFGEIILTPEHIK